jgi:hypothetical protein
MPQCRQAAIARPTKRRPSFIPWEWTLAVWTKAHEFLRDEATSPHCEVSGDCRMRHLLAHTKDVSTNVGLIPDHGNGILRHGRIATTPHSPSTQTTPNQSDLRGLTKRTWGNPTQALRVHVGLRLTMPGRQGTASLVVGTQAAWHRTTPPTRKTPWVCWCPAPHPAATSLRHSRLLRPRAIS